MQDRFRMAGQAESHVPPAEPVGLEEAPEGAKRGRGLHPRCRALWGSAPQFVSAGFISLHAGAEVDGGQRVAYPNWSRITGKSGSLIVLSLMVLALFCVLRCGAVPSLPCPGKEAALHCALGVLDHIADSDELLVWLIGQAFLATVGQGSGGGALGSAPLGRPNDLHARSDFVRAGVVFQVESVQTVIPVEALARVCVCHVKTVATKNRRLTASLLDIPAVFDSHRIRAASQPEAHYRTREELAISSHLDSGPLSHAVWLPRSDPAGKL
jgi:hypothetical protein